MKYNTEYLDVKYALIQGFLRKLPKEVVDISYLIQGKIITVQVVLLEEVLLDEAINKTNEILGFYEIRLKKVFISKEKFNNNKGNWLPESYAWLPNLLFSKAEVL